MRIAAVADIHSPKYLEEFRESLRIIDTPDVLLFAGDMINFGRAAQYSKITQVIESTLAPEVPIAACFGNEEFEAARQEIRNLTKGTIMFLDNAAAIMEIGLTRLGVIGAPAPTDVRGRKQDLIDIGLREIYESRAKSLGNLVRETAADTEHTILLMHYSPLSERMNENDVSKYSWWISKTIEDLQPDIVIHGHLHRAERLETRIGNTRIINVAFPAAQKITEILL